MKKQLHNHEHGFTIMELLVATMVFSVLLLIATGTIVELSKQFYKGLIQSRTQEVARNVGEEISRNMEFSSTPPQQLFTDANSEIWCIADRRYIFIRGKQLGTAAHQSRAVAVRTGTACGGPVSSPLGYIPSGTDEELVGQNMRLADLTIEEGPNNTIWGVRVRVLHADDAIVCSPAAGDCNDETESSNLTAQDLACKTQAGSQFCAAADYSMNVVRRL